MGLLVAIERFYQLALGSRGRGPATEGQRDGTLVTFFAGGAEGRGPRRPPPLLASPPEHLLPEPPFPIFGVLVALQLLLLSARNLLLAPRVFSRNRSENDALRNEFRVEGQPPGSIGGPISGP